MVDLGRGRRYELRSGVLYINRKKTTMKTNSLKVTSDNGKDKVNGKAVKDIVYAA